MMLVTCRWQHCLHSAPFKEPNEELCLLIDALKKCEEGLQKRDFFHKVSKRYIFRKFRQGDFFLVKWKTGISFEANNPLLAKNHMAFLEEGTFVIYSSKG